MTLGQDQHKLDSIVTFSGLSSQEAGRRLAQDGPNTLPTSNSPGILASFIEQFKSPLIGILLFALVFDLGVWFFEGTTGVPLESLAIAAILLLNAALGVWQEYRAEAALDKLKALAAAKVWVLRDGQFQRLAHDLLVIGDVIRLEAGDRIPADAVVLRSAALLVDEAILTGESFPVDKQADDQLMSGTLVLRGQGEAQINRTGQQSAMGQLATMLDHIENEKTPLEQRLDHLGLVIARWVALLVVGLIILGLALQGLSHFAEIFLFAVALAVAAVPEGLPAVLSATLALGTERLAKRKAVVRRLTAVEALGSVTVIASDKTGTITENTMQVRVLDSTNEAEALTAMLVVNDAEIDSSVGDPLDIALLNYLRDRGWQLERLRQSFRRRSLRAFDADWQFMRVTVDTADGQILSYLKGAPEVILDRCQLSQAEVDNWREKMSAYAAQGYRTLALAYGPGQCETELSFLGLLALLDPPRAEVAQAVATAQAAGIRVIMMTGDHPATALAIAKDVGIMGEQVLTGGDLEALDQQGLISAVQDVSIFARVRPEHKLSIVEALKEAGQVVAVTGDGVNDAPALKRADVGVAMGQRGSDISREVADLILLDDNFATIVAAVEGGRSIYANIQKFLRFLFVTNASEVITVIIGIILSAILGRYGDDGRLLLPLTAVQILWINLVTDAFPALAMALDRNPEVMAQPPLPKSQPLLDRASVRFIIIAASILSCFVLFTIYALPSWGFSQLEARSLGFMLLVIGQLLYGFSSRKLQGAAAFNPYLLAAVVLGIALQLVMAWLPALRTVIDLSPISTLGLLWVAFAALCSTLISELTVHLLRTQP